MRIGDLVKTETQEGKEKHVPVIELVDYPDCTDKIVKITVGKEVPHPNTIAHHIKWIHLYGVKEGLAVHMAAFDLGPTYGIPEVTCHANLAEFSELIAIEYCNIHGLWESSFILSP
ncbi:class II SORL domain-containing protein [Candidatus Bipolaricaulota bacterium]|nr:class II SORL domain-containing protein [Candidatus Bipolaricaulota bacterium]HBR10154.1 desulfoferrodoxin [Candidatus Acetothermia bacterium]